MNFLFIGFFSFLDAPLTFVVDTIRLPVDSVREDQPREKWDTVNHRELGNCKEYGFFRDILNGI